MTEPACGWLLMKASMTTADLPAGALSTSGAALNAVLDRIPLGELGDPNQACSQMAVLNPTQRGPLLVSELCGRRLNIG